MSPVTRSFVGMIVLASLAIGSDRLIAQRGRQPSPDGVAATEVRGRYVGDPAEPTYEGGKWIEVTYSRPIKRGRDLWGKGADYGRMLNGGAPVWRAGANVSTRLRTELPLVINNKTLAPGEYTFHVQGSNSRGTWNREGASVHFSILPPWWNTGWFRAVALAAFLLSLGFAYYFRIHSIERQFNMRLEERVGERTRIARELHDTLLQSFQGLMFRFQAVLDLLPSRPVEAREAFENALDRADQAITEGRDAIQDLRSSTVERNDLAPAVRALGEELAGDDPSGEAPTFRLVVEGTPQNLHPILRDEIYRIAREALRNAFQHAHARRIEAEFTYDEGLFRLRIRDDGSGIDPHVLDQGNRPGHWGLAGMRERAKRIGAQLEVWSQPGAGTEIELSIPGAIAFGTSAMHAGFGRFRKKTEPSHGR